MKRRVCMAIISCMLLSSCEKLLDYYNINEGDQIPACKVTALDYIDEFFENNTQITYTPNGYPSTIIYTSYDIGFDYTNSYTFNYNYDNLSRIVSQTSDWVYGPYLVYYDYEGNSLMPARDTLPGIFGPIYVEDFEYDALGRIIKIVKRVIEQWPDDETVYKTLVYKYYYDIRGNRQENPSNPDYPGLIQYTDQPSLYSLHPVWQIVHKDFSKNSVLNVEAYNDKGLPAKIKRKNIPGFPEFLDMLPGSEITYDCVP
jgi:hypothetical protein